MLTTPWLGRLPKEHQAILSAKFPTAPGKSIGPTFLLIPYQLHQQRPMQFRHPILKHQIKRFQNCRFKFNSLQTIASRFVLTVTHSNDQDRVQEIILYPLIQKFVTTTTVSAILLANECAQPCEYKSSEN